MYVYRGPGSGELHEKGTVLGGALHFSNAWQIRRNIKQTYFRYVSLIKRILSRGARRSYYVDQNSFLGVLTGMIIIEYLSAVYDDTIASGNVVKGTAFVVTIYCMTILIP